MDQHKYILLRDAVNMYIDDGEVAECLHALKVVIAEEEEAFKQKLRDWKDLRKKLFK